MNDPTIEALIHEKMGEDGGKQPAYGPTAAGRHSSSPAEMSAWAQDMHAWSRAVRRDILVLEYHLTNLAGKKLEMYDDPGDPPPPPE